eukprot:947549-Amphidinium_carterae.1
MAVTKMRRARKKRITRITRKTLAMRITLIKRTCPNLGESHPALCSSEPSEKPSQLGSETQHLN